VSYTAAPVLDAGVPVGAVITFQDITERKAHEDEMFHHAYHDSLTGLGNRRLMVEHLERALEESKVDGRTHALIFVDIDRFKAINDSLGHVTGDDLLVAIAARIKSTTRTGDLLARFGGDEFIVLLEDVSGVEEAVAAAERICTAVEKPMILADGYEIVASLSVGITLTEQDKSIDDILRDADVAMYEAKVKGGGGGYKVFDLAAMGSRSPDRVSLEADLRRSMERDELDVYYQPFFSVADHQIVGCEALVRWNHPTRGLLDPGRFIGLAEETGLILPIGQFVLERACQQARTIRDRLGIELPMSVNLSARQFRQNSLVGDVAGALDRAGLDPGSLILEITETMVMDDIAGAREVMKRLNKLGVRLAIDDFGTGHSSLSYLKQFPVHEVKVDRQFVSGLSEHPVDTAIVRAVIELAAAMGMQAVAEGVETVEQLAGLRMLGCPVAQGFYFSRPLPAADFGSLLDRQFGPPAPIIELRPKRLVS
jgi:diguanylate cyclase (GGDEF)-like protein